MCAVDPKSVRQAFTHVCFMTFHVRDFRFSGNTPVGTVDVSTYIFLPGGPETYTVYCRQRLKIATPPRYVLFLSSSVTSLPLLALS